MLARTTLAGSRLTAVTLVRSLRRRKVRAVAAIAAGVCGLALTTAVLTLSFSVLDAIRGVALSSVGRANLVAVAKSSSGMDASIERRMRRAVRGAETAPVLLANTRLGQTGHSRIVVVGATNALRRLVSPATARQLRRLQPLGRGRALYLGAAFARDHHLRAGEQLAIQTPGGVERWTIRGLIDSTFANRGAFAFAALPVAALAFQRGATIDMIFLRVSAAGGARTALMRATRGAASLVAPPQATGGWTKSFRSVRSLLTVFALIAVVTSAAIVFFAWRLTIEDERLNLARLRLVGARKRHLAGGAALLALPSLALSILIGCPLGLLFGSSLSGFSDNLVTLVQLAAQPTMPVLAPVLVSAAIGAGMFAVAWVAAARALFRVPVAEGISARRAAPAPRHGGLIALVGILGALAGAVALATLPVGTRAVAMAGLLLALGAGSLVVPSAVGRLVARAPRWTALAIGRELVHGARRGAALIAVFALAIAMAIAVEGATASLHRDMDASVRAWTQADLFVQSASSGKNLQDDKFPASTASVLARAPGVAATGWFTYTMVDVGSQRIPLWTWGADGHASPARYARLDVVEGPRGAAYWRMLDRGKVAVSTNYARLEDVGVGDVVRIPARGGVRRLRVGAIVKDLVSDGGVVFVSQRLYRRMTGDARRYQLLVTLAPHASLVAARRYLRAHLARRYPDLVVWDRAEIRHHFAGLTAGLLSAFTLIGRVMFVLALLIGATTIAATLVVRQRSLAVVQLAGASRKRLRRQLLWEHFGLGVCAWLVGLPIGLALVPAIVNAVTLGTGLLPTIRLPWGMAAATLPAAVAMAVVALFVAAGPSRALPPIARLLTDE